MSAPLLQVISATHRRGAEISALDLRDALRGRGWNMHLVALRDEPGEGGLDVPALGRRRFSGLRELRRLIRTSRGVLAHGSDTLPATVLAGVAIDVPFVYRSIGDPRYWSRRVDRRLRVRAELHRAEAVVATFQGAADDLVASYGVPASRVHVIANGRPLSRFPEPTDADRAAARAALLPGVAEPIVAFLGSLSHEKAPERAVQAVAQLPEVHLVVAGSGPLRGLVEHYGQALAPGRVHLVGPVDDPRPLLLAADALLVPSRSEGFPGAVVEAGLCGLPVVATDAGGTADALVPGVTGLVVPAVADHDRTELMADALADALDQVLARRAEMGAAGRSHCERRFDAARITDQWASLLAQVLP